MPIFANSSSRIAFAVTLGLVAGVAAAQSPPPNVMVPTAETAPRNGNGNGKHAINLQGADISVLVQTVSEITGKSFIVDPRVDGKVTVISSKQMTPSEVYEVFQSVLRVHGFAAVPAGNMVKIVPETIAAQDGGGSGVASGIGGVDELVTRVVEVKHISAQEVATLLRPLMPQQGHLLAHGNSNSLLITDRAGNVDRLISIIRRIDTSADVEVEVIPLRHASAAEVGRTVTALEPQAGAAPIPGAMRMVADDRTNSILLSGDRTQRLRMRALIAHLDTPLESGDNTQVIYLRNARASELVPILDSVAGTLTGTAVQTEGAKSATIQPHEGTNALIITSSPAVFRELASVVRQLDVPSAQILVEAIIAEVTDELADELGVQWQSTNIDSDGNGGITSGVIGGTNFPGQGNGGIVGALTNPLSALGSGLNLGYVSGTVSIPGIEGPVIQVGALVKALRGDSRANVLSNPQVVTLDHREAEFKVVQEVPFLTGQYTNTGTGGTSQPTNPFQTIERKDVGVILTVTPHVNEGTSVRLDLKQEVSSLAPGVQGATDLITSKRELTTSVMVPDGAMLVLGGLISDETLESIQGVPGLSRIPLLGNLFKNRASSRSKRNLMIFIRPRILRDEAVQAAISNEKYSYLRAEQLRLRQNKELRYDGEQTPMLPALPPTDLFSAPPPITDDPAYDPRSLDERAPVEEGGSD